jgi:hypothetical protein
LCSAVEKESNLTALEYGSTRQDRRFSGMRDFFDPTPEQRVIVLVETATLHQA